MVADNAPSRPLTVAHSEARVTAALSDDRAGNIAVEYVWGIQYVNELLVVINDGSEHLYPTWDAQFRITALLDSSGGVKEHYGYTPYGEPTVLKPDHSEHRDPLTGSCGLRIGHQGLRHDAPTAGGLIYNRNRMLHPAVGRFVQRDPLDQNQPGGGYHDGMNLYEYVRSNSILYRDPKGLWIPVAPIIAAAKKKALAAATAAAKAAWGFCKSIRCKVEIHGVHHSFPGLGKKCHVQATCWRKGIIDLWKSNVRHCSTS